jgi:regulator of PEP synthase PpsR (kinase-PPPase family)
MTKFHVHLVSDATGETLRSVARAVIVQFQQARESNEHLWALVRSAQQMEEVLKAISELRGIVLYTLVDPALRDRLGNACKKLGIPCVSVLDPIVDAFAKFLGEEAHPQPGLQHELDANYFARIAAMSYTLAHDDGQNAGDLDQADIVLVGVSRTSKTPTSIYLANQGLKTANVPIVPGATLPGQLTRLAAPPPGVPPAAGPQVVGLVINPDRLVMVRRQRLMTMRVTEETDYIDLDVVRSEVAEARKIFQRYNWPVIDVTRRSIEETAAAVLNLHARRQEASF